MHTFYCRAHGATDWGDPVNDIGIAEAALAFAHRFAGSVTTVDVKPVLSAPSGQYYVVNIDATMVFSVKSMRPADEEMGGETT